MNKRELKKLMTDLAKGKVTQQEVDKMLQKGPMEQKKTTNVRKKKKSSKAREVK